MRRRLLQRLVRRIKGGSAVRQPIRPMAIGFFLALLGATLGFATPGCSVYYFYELRLVVRALPDGCPLTGVRVDLQAKGLREDWPGSVSKDEDGTLVTKFSVSAGQFYKLPSWRLVLSQPGYHDEVIDISPRNKPESGAPPTQLVVIANMRPKSP